MNTRTVPIDSSNEISTDLTNYAGVVILQKSQKGEFAAQFLGLPYEATNHYLVKALPEHVTIPPNKNDLSKLWRPTLEEILALPDLLSMKEDSDFGTRVVFVCCGCRALRPLNIVVSEMDGTPRMNFDKPCKCGGWICCPLEINVTDSTRTRQVGMVKENFTPYCSKCADMCCCCSVYHNIYSYDQTGGAPMAQGMDRSFSGASSDPKYELKFHLCCCQGETNNCCGATCFNHNAIFDIRHCGTTSFHDNKKRENGAVAAHVQKLYAPATNSTCAGFCRMCAGFDTFAVQFPPEASHNERIMLIAGVLQAEFQLFEQDQD